MCVCEVEGMRLPKILEVITVLNAEKIRTMFSQKTMPEASKMKLKVFLSWARSTDAADGVVRNTKDKGYEREKRKTTCKGRIEADNSLGGWGLLLLMQTGENNSEWKDEDWISSSQARTLPASKQRDEKMTRCCSLTDGWTIPHPSDGSPSHSQPLSLHVSDCQCPISAPLNNYWAARGADIALSQHTNVEDYLSQSSSAS